ncbi:MAG: tol-pal system protein YbgF [Gammaproteobacteria bacterium]|nr:tol-pal system protein YbgF [Gammaproteobacteria bacterium]
MTAGLFAVLAVTGASVAAQAPVLEPRPAVERQQPPLITPPGAQRSEQARPAGAGQQRQGVIVTGEDGSQTVPFRPPVLDAPGGDEGGMSAVPESLSGVVLQLQQLQQEVMMLRGRVESQQHTISRLEREQRERYLDLDRRLARGGAAASESLADPYAPLDPEMPAGGSADERSAYEAAFALTRERDFEAAIGRFRNLIENYPGGAYEANSWYWLGEIYLALSEPDLEESRQAFVQVLERWPDHHKIPDALYKLGVVYHQLGEPDAARQYLQRVRTEFAGSSAARLATGYLERI